MSRTRFALNALLVAAAGFGVVAPEARAGFTITLASTTPSTTAGDTQFNYTATIATGDNIVSGDYFRIYDFSGYVPSSTTAPAGWTSSVSTSNAAPPNMILTHGDDPAVPNLTYTYNGTSAISGPLTLSGFSAQSTQSAAGTVKDFIGVLTAADGSSVSSIGDVKVPTFTLGPPAATPEPSSLISGGIGLIGCGLFYARRRARSRHNG